MKVITRFETGFELRLSGNNLPSAGKTFCALVLEAIDSTLSALGVASKQVFYGYVETHFGVRKENIPDHIADFASALESIFGQAAFILESRIMQVLHEKVKDFRYFPLQGELSFVDYVENLSAFL